jgi:N-carbamoyl-L-amino-acid hydrolase
MSAQDVVRDLRTLAGLTSTAEGAQRLAWGPVWREARSWFAAQARALGVEGRTDAAGNTWYTLPGASRETVIIGGHLDSVPNGGWLDGTLGVMAGLGALRMFKDRHLPLSIAVVDWADEEGARFGRSLLGSSAASGSLKVEDVRGLVDKEGTTLPDALRENGIELDRMLEAHEDLKKVRARGYLELHIEQGPVLESLNKPTGVVLGTFGVERHMLRFVGQAAHSGSTPIPMRRDAYLAAAETALACREIATRHSTPSAGVVCTVGVVRVEPGIVTAVPGVCEISLDQRALDAGILGEMLFEARRASEAAGGSGHARLIPCSSDCVRRRCTR